MKISKILVLGLLSGCVSCVGPQVNRSPAQANAATRFARLVECTVDIGQVKSFTEFDVSPEVTSSEKFTQHAPRKETLEISGGKVSVAYSVQGVDKDFARVNVGVRSVNNLLVTLSGAFSRHINSDAVRATAGDIDIRCRSMDKEISRQQPSTYGSNSQQ
jgi:hypothetical protein